MLGQAAGALSAMVASTPGGGAEPVLVAWGGVAGVAPGSWLRRVTLRGGARWPLVKRSARVYWSQ